MAFRNIFGRRTGEPEGADQLAPAQGAVTEAPRVSHEPESAEPSPAPARSRRGSRTRAAGELEPVQGDISPDDFPEVERRRRRRGGRRRSGSGEASAADPTAPIPAPESADALETSPESARRRSPRATTPRQLAPEANSDVATPGEAAPRQLRRPAERQPEEPRRRDTEKAPAGLEALIARQNVILESFAQKQLTAIKTIERSMMTLSQRLGTDFAPAAAGGAMPKVGVFVDVPNVIYAAERLGVTINFGKLLSYLMQGRALVRASAYAPISDDPMARLDSQKFVQPFMEYGYRIVTKPLKRFADGSIKGNFDVELAMDVLTMSDRLDVVSLVSGDGDFRRMCEIVASKGVRIEVIAFGTSTAGELRTVADTYIDISEHLDELSD